MKQGPLILFLLLAGLPALQACGGNGSDEKEVRRVTSPDGTVDAVLTVDYGSGGATGGSVLALYLVPIGEGFEEGVAALHAERATGLNLRWQDESLLEFGYREGEISRFTNLLYFDDQQGRSYRVEVRLRALDDSAFD